MPISIDRILNKDESRMVRVPEGVEPLTLREATFGLGLTEEEFHRMEMIVFCFGHKKLIEQVREGLDFMEVRPELKEGQLWNEEISRERKKTSLALGTAELEKLELVEDDYPIYEILKQDQERQHKQELDAPEELDEYDLNDLTADELMSSYGLEILCQETGFLQRFAEWERNSRSNEVPEAEYDLVRQLIQQHPELLKTQTETEKDRNMLV